MTNDLDLLQREVENWQAITFPDGTVIGKCGKLREEVDELCNEPHDPSEAADCLLVLLGIAAQSGYSLYDEAMKKFHTNKYKRTWKKREDGHYDHVDIGE